MQARAESWKQGLDEALQRGTATLKSLRVHMQQQEADLKACMQQQKQQREAEFKALEKVCCANVEATAKLHYEADERAGRLQKKFDIIRSKEKSLEKQNKGLTQEVKDQQLTIVDLQSSLEACKGNTNALEGQNTSLLLRSLDLEHAQTALKEQVQSLQRGLTSAHAQQAASSQTELAQAAAAVAVLEKQLRHTEVREEVLKRIVLLMGEQQNALTGEKSKLKTYLAAALQANQAHAASINAADTMIAQDAASLAIAKAEAKQTSDQHAKVLAAAEAAAQQAVKQAADAADMQASNHLAAMHTINQAAKTEAVVEAAQSYAADRASWAAEKADLLEKLQAASAVRSVMPDAHASQLYAELASTQERVTSAEQVADTHAGSTSVVNAQSTRQQLATDSTSSRAHVTATLARADALSSQHGQSSVLGATQQAPGMQLQGLPREGAFEMVPHEHSFHDQQSDSPRTVEQVMQQLQQLQKFCCQMLGTAAGVQCDTDGQVTWDQVPGISASIGRLAKQVQQLQDAVPHALGVPHAAGAQGAASQHSAHDPLLHDAVTVEEQLRQPQQQQQQAPPVFVQPEGTSVGSDAAQSCQQGRVELSEAGHLGDALPLSSAPAQNSPGQGCVPLQPGPLQHGHFRSEKVQVNADGLAAELKVQQGQQGTSTGILALLH